VRLYRLADVDVAFKEAERIFISRMRLKMIVRR